jgi:ABC-type bacteriocin/lantibiotic exporter with double-glycine peptidase domain
LKKLNCFLFIIGILCLFSCSTVQEVPESGDIHIIKDVPFYPQEDFQCGPSSLAMVLNHYGIRTSPDEIAEEIFSGSARGTLNIDMVIYAQKSGLRVLQFKGNSEDLKRNIDAGNPLIVLVDYGFSLYQLNHFMVIAGYSGHGVIVNSGKNKEQFIQWKEFLRVWEKAGFWTLLIEPGKESGGNIEK